MPNHITNRIQIKGTQEQVEEVIEAFGVKHPAKLHRSFSNEIICRKEDGQFGWFNEKTGLFSQRGKDSLVGLPEGFEMEITESFLQFPDFEKVIPPPSNIFRGGLGEKERQMCIDENRPNWYDWNRENWGTKWNSYSFEKINKNTYKFETAWVGVPKILTAMSLKFPEVEFLYKYADEDTAYNTGIMKFLNGNIIEENHPEGGSFEAYELYFELNPNDRAYYKLIDGNYEYIDED